jgi:hypothetical protein
MSVSTSTFNLNENEKSNKPSSTSLSSFIKKPTAFIVNFDDNNSISKKNENLQEAFLKYRNYKMVILEK